MVIPTVQLKQFQAQNHQGWPIFCSPPWHGACQAGGRGAHKPPPTPTGPWAGHNQFIPIFLAKKWHFGHGEKCQIDCLCHILWAIGILWPPPKWPQVCPWPPRWPGPHTLQPPWPFPNLAACLFLDLVQLISNWVTAGNIPAFTALIQIITVSLLKHFTHRDLVITIK